MARPKKNATPPPKIDVARQALAAEKKAKRKVDPFMDKAVNWLKGHSGADGEVPVLPIELVLTEAYEMANPNAAAVLGFMKQASRDPRLNVQNKDGKESISIAQEEPADETKTLAEHVAEAEGKPTKIPFPHQIGTWVAYVREQGTFSAKILNIHTTGNVSLYDLKMEDGKTIKQVPAFEISQIQAGELGRIKAEEHSNALQKHADHGRKLGQRRNEIMAQEVADSEALKATRKRLAKIEEQISNHLGMSLENGQQELDLEVEDDGEAEISDATPANDALEHLPGKSLAEETAIDRLRARIIAKDVLELEDGAQPWAALKDAAIQGTASTGKPPRIKPFKLDQAAGSWVVVDQSDGVVVLLKAVTKEEWLQNYQEAFDAPRDLPNQEPTIKQAAGGPMTGSPVKVGRTTMYLTPLDEALLLQRSKTAASA